MGSSVSSGCSSVRSVDGFRLGTSFVGSSLHVNLVPMAAGSVVTIVAASAPLLLPDVSQNTMLLKNPPLLLGCRVGC